MDKHPSLPPDTDRESLSKLEQDFYLIYGSTLAAWARLEQTLGQLFCVLCGFDPDNQLGRELFFSGRSFQTRADLLSAALRVSETPEEVKAVVRAVRKKARDYSGSRNAIAHGYPSHSIFPNIEWQGWRIKEGEQSHLPGGIGIEELKAAKSNFWQLEWAAESATSLVRNHQRGYPQPPEEHLERVQALPPNAFLPSRYQIEEEARQRGEA
jgi:hypothetical protein